jgi:hypothetical protein
MFQQQQVFQRFQAAYLKLNQEKCQLPWPVCLLLGICGCICRHRKATEPTHGTEADFSLVSRHHLLVIVDMNTRKVGIGCMLSQVKEGQNNVAAYYSGRLRLILWPTVSRPVCLGFNFLMFANYFLCSSCREPCLTRGWVCSSQCNHSLVRVAQNS